MTKVLPTIVIVSFVATLVAWVVIAYDHRAAVPTHGITELEIVFDVTDGKSGTPIPGAEIEFGFQGQNELLDKRPVPKTDSAGRSTLVHPNVFDASLVGGFGRTLVNVVPLPQWVIRVSANGYRRTDFIEIGTEKNVNAVWRVDAKRHRLIVPITLTKGP